MPLWFALSPLPSGLYRLRAYRLSRGRLWLTCDQEGPLGEALEMMRALAEWRERGPWAGEALPSGPP